MEVEISFETVRWCGFRSPAKNGPGIYLIGPADFEPCERVPFPLEACPCCGAGIKPARGFTWIDPGKLFDPYNARPYCCDVRGEPIEDLEHDHETCPLCRPRNVAGEEAGLLWVGEKFYKTAYMFMEEAHQMGISRKVGALPNNFVVGTHTVYLAHRKSALRFNTETNAQEWLQGVFTAFKPTRVDIVIDDPGNVPDKAIQLAERLGDKARIVKVIPITEEGMEVADVSEDW